MSRTIGVDYAHLEKDEPAHRLGESRAQGSGHQNLDRTSTASTQSNVSSVTGSASFAVGSFQLKRDGSFQLRREKPRFVNKESVIHEENATPLVSDRRDSGAMTRTSSTSSRTAKAPRGRMTIRRPNNGQLEAEDGEDHAANERAKIFQQWLDVDTDAYNSAIGAFILLNAIVLGLETEFGEESYILCEHFFCLFFSGEMIMRMRQHGWQDYLSHSSQVFDCFLVMSSIVSLYIMPCFSVSQQNSGLVMLLRIMRLARVLRILRIFKMFRGLTIILGAFSAALSTVVWVGTLTTTLDYILAIFLTQTIGRNAAAFGDDEAKVTMWFGSIGNSMQTLFIIMTLAQWDEIAMIASKVYPSGVVFLLAVMYIIIAAYTMVSLITGIISDKLIAAQQADLESRMHEIEAEKVELATHIKKILSQIDDDGNAYLTPEEVTNALDKDARLTDRLAALNIHLDRQGLDRLMNRLADDDGQCEGVSIDALADGLMQMNGQARASEIFDLRHQVQKMTNKMSVLESKLDSLVAHFGVQPTAQAWTSQDGSPLQKEHTR